MAAEWIKWSKGLARKPEVMQIAHRLGVSRHAAAGILMEVWEWADDNVIIDDGASGFDPDNCPGSVRLGEQSLSLFDATFGVSGLADAMTAVGWIVIRSGSLVFPNFARHNGKSAKARALDSARKRTARQGSPPNVPKQSGSQPDKTRTRGEEKRREKKEDKEDSSEPAPPASKPPSAEEVVLTFPVVGTAKFWPLTRRQVERWRELYPGLDVVAECRKALAWCEANPAKRKTERGMTGFLNRWLVSAVDGSRGQRPPTHKTKAERDQEQLEREFEASHAHLFPGAP